VAVLMKHLEESHKAMEDDLDIEAELEAELAAQEEIMAKLVDDIVEPEDPLVGGDDEDSIIISRPNQRTFNGHSSSSKQNAKDKASSSLPKVTSLPNNFIFTYFEEDINKDRGNAYKLNI